MTLHLPVLGTFVDWACGSSKDAPGTALDQLGQDKAEARQQICAVMERLAEKHGVAPQNIDPQTLGFVDEALDVLMAEREDELNAELELEDQAEPR